MTTGAKVVTFKSALKSQASPAQQQQEAAIKRHSDAEILRRWDLRQSTAQISRRMGIGILRVEQALREHLRPIAPQREEGSRYKCTRRA